MFITTGSEKVVSFTDDAAPDKRNLSKQRNISINGQIKRGTSLKWFYELLFLCRQVKGEVKGRPHALDAFKSMSSHARTKLWETLKEVQINISDPLPYEVETNSFYQKYTNKKETIEMLRQRAISNDPAAKKMLELLNNQTAERILFDAPSRRLSLNIYFAQNPAAIWGRKEFSNMFPAIPDYEVDISFLKSQKSGSIVRAATEYTAKSASVFAGAIDACFERPYWNDHPLLNPVLNELRKAHGFDKGNKPFIDLMENERKEINSQIARRQQWFEYHEGLPLEPLEGNIDSKESYFIQASDFAAGIASHLYEIGEVFAVTQHFEYVMLNGKRFSPNEAFETLKKWKESGFYN
jgi:hypothetical protein